MLVVVWLRYYSPSRQTRAFSSALPAVAACGPSGPLSPSQQPRRPPAPTKVELALACHPCARGWFPGCTALSVSSIGVPHCPLCPGGLRQHYLTQQRRQRASCHAGLCCWARGAPLDDFDAVSHLILESASIAKDAHSLKYWAQPLRNFEA